MSARVCGFLLPPRAKARPDRARRGVVASCVVQKGRRPVIEGTTLYLSGTNASPLFGFIGITS